MDLSESVRPLDEADLCEGLIKYRAWTLANKNKYENQKRKTCQEPMIWSVIFESVFSNISALLLPLEFHIIFFSHEWLRGRQNQMVRNYYLWIWVDFRVFFRAICPKGEYTWLHWRSESWRSSRRWISISWSIAWNEHQNMSWSHH